MECQICCEKFTKRDRKEIKCPSPDCEGSYCLSCFKRFIIESEDIMPTCMCCSKELSYSFVRQHVPITWANKDYVNKRANHLLAREKSLLPDSQRDVKKELDRRRCVDEEKQIFEEIRNLRMKIDSLHLKCQTMWNQHYTKFDSLRKDKNVIVTRRRCPVDDCEGFLENNWKCGICEVKCCSHCGEVEEENHECNEETKATFQMIKNETRPCPQCGIPIHKWQGCNQMYCTQCSCMFDYRTGRLETGFFHNPHYFEAIDNGTITARGNGHNACGFPDAWTFTTRLRSLNLFLNQNEKENIKRIKNLYSLISHITDVTLRRKWLEGEFDQSCRTMRRNYLLKELDETKWLQQLREIEKKREKNTEVRQLVTLFRDVSRDCIVNISEILGRLGNIFNYRTDDEMPLVEVNGVFVEPIHFIMTQLDEVDKMSGFFNEKMLDMKKKFKLSMPYIDSNYRQYDCKQF
jgi:hypothetical protein